MPRRAGPGPDCTLQSQPANAIKKAVEREGITREHYAFCPDHIAQALQSGAFRLGISDWPDWHF